MLAELVVDGIHGLGESGLFLPIFLLKEKHLLTVLPDV